MLLVVVALPDRGVVLRAVGLGDLVVQWALERRRARNGRIGVLVGEVGVTLVAELGEDHEHLVGALLLELDVLVLRLAALSRLALLAGGLLVGERGRVGRRVALAHLDDGRAVLGDGLRVSVDDGRDRGVAQSLPLRLERVGQSVPALDRSVLT